MQKNKNHIMDTVSDKRIVENIFALLTSLPLSRESWQWLSEKTAEKIEGIDTQPIFNQGKLPKYDDTLTKEERKKRFTSLAGIWENDPDAEIILRTIKEGRETNRENRKIIAFDD